MSQPEDGHRASERAESQNWTPCGLRQSEWMASGPLDLTQCRSKRIGNLIKFNEIFNEFMFCVFWFVFVFRHQPRVLPAIFLFFLGFAMWEGNTCTV